MLMNETGRIDSREMARCERMARTIKALAHPARLWVVEQLEQGERCVCEFVGPLGLDFSTVSKHLLVLKKAGIVECRRNGKQMIYRLRVPCILKFMGCVEAVLNNGEVL
jgi:ArsR family transcriptional regulator